MDRNKSGNEPKHLILPSEAIMTIEVMESYMEGVSTFHVAFTLGVSRKHLEKVKRRLLLASNGDEDACREYNSRTSIMRNLASYYRLLETDPDYIRGLLNDAIIYASSDRNVLHGRGGKEIQLSGLSEIERDATVTQFRHYAEN